MFLCKKRKDGGKDSPVDAYFLVESKRFFSIALLRFNKGGREAFHTHAFNALTWFLWGDLEEEDVQGELYEYHRSLLPKITPKDKNHRVVAVRDSWCLTLRGPWCDRWLEYRQDRNETTEFTHGREVKSITSGLNSG